MIAGKLIALELRETGRVILDRTRIKHVDDVIRECEQSIRRLLTDTPSTALSQRELSTTRNTQMLAYA